MANILKAFINGTDYGIGGQARVAGWRASASTVTHNGQATLILKYPYGAGYSFVPFRDEVQLYRVITGGNAYVFGGFVSKAESETIWTADPTAAYELVTLTCVDYNVLQDAITNDSTTMSTTIAAGTLAAQVASAVQTLQEQGHGAVSKAIRTATVGAGGYVNNITGATVLPAFVVTTETLRQVLRKIMANAQAAVSTVRPRWGLIEGDDGAGGPQCCLAVWDAASPPTSVLTLSYQASGAEKSVHAERRVLDGSMPLVNRLQSIWGTAGNTRVSTYQSSASATAGYKNPYVNHALTGNKGYWMGPVVQDSTSTSTGEAATALGQRVESLDYPRETFRMVYDSPNTDTLALLPSNAVTVKWAPHGVSSTVYDIAEIMGEMVVRSDSAYERITLTLGLPLLELYDNGVDGAVAAPSIIGGVLPKPVNLAYTSGIDQGMHGWINLTWDAVNSAQGYRVYRRNSVGGPTFFVGYTETTTITWRNTPVPYAGYMVVCAVNFAGADGMPSDEKAVSVGISPDHDPTPGGWDAYDPEATIRGLELIAGSASEVSFDTTVQYKGKASLKLTNGAGGNTAPVGPKYDCFGGEAVTVGAARKRSTGTGTAPNTALKVEWYKADDSASSTAESTVWDAIATTSFVYTELKLTAPADAKYFRVMCQQNDVGGGGTGYSSYFSFPLVKREINNNDLPTTLTLAAGQKIVATGGGSPARFDVTDADGTVIGYVYGAGTSGLGNQAMYVQAVGAGVKLQVAGGDGGLELAASAGGISALNIFTLASAGAAWSTGKKINGGTSFPGSPTSGDAFFRTDLGVLCYYDGTRWLGPEYALGSWQYYPDANNGFELGAAGTTEHQYTSLRTDRATYCTRWAIQGYVNGTSDSSNYWEIIIRTFSGLTNLQTTPQDTKLWTASTWSPVEVTTFNTQPTTSSKGLEVVVTKHGSPGALRFSHTLYVKEVYT